MFIDEADLSGLAPESTTDYIKKTLNAIFWSWYSMNEDRKLTTVRWWIISKTIYLRDLKEVFALLFGDEPIGVTAI